MARPRKWRTVCDLPRKSRFGPYPPGGGPYDRVIMGIDEYETIRLIDYEGFTQEECAQQMNIARTTIQGIYSVARRKLADAIVNGKMILIEGGDYVLCDGTQRGCQTRGCGRHRQGQRFQR